MSWNALNVMPCDAALGDPHDLSLLAGAYTLDTDTGQLSGVLTQPLSVALIAQTSGPMVRVVNIGQLSIGIGATVSITGTHPLVFVVHGDATIAGTIDSSAHSNVITDMSTAGPGGDDNGACTGGVGADGKVATSTGGGGGAGGGGFGDQGGDGGDGQGSGRGMHGVHGNAIGNATLVPLRGGCPGGHGGATMTSAPGGRAGNGGGALEVTARGVIDVSGTLKAAGSGGGPSPHDTDVNGGGGAGGSGGAILLDGDTVQVEASGKLCANGGGGGEGGQSGVQTAFGEDGTCSETTAARGGMVDPDGGDGGAGGRIGLTTGQTGLGGSNNAGGGGGGGSVGRIRVHGRATTGTPVTIDGGATVSPAAVP
jgi:hypothetical protein